jgi:hypothetical protein
MINYKNRYGDVYTFEKTDDGHILIKGDFKWLRFGYPNDYTKSYNEYVNDHKGQDNVMSFKQFKDNVHSYDEEAGKLVYEKYTRLVESRQDTINMMDPSGGPYMCEGMDMSVISNSFSGMTIKEFKPTPEGYKIIIYEQ